MTASELTEPVGIDFDPYSPALTEPTVWPLYRRLCLEGPVGYSARHGGFYLVGGYEEVKSALRDPTVFSSAAGHRIPADGTQLFIPIDFDPPLHTTYRSIMAAALAPDRVRALQPFLHRTIEELVADFVDAAGGDFVSAVALPLPLQVLTAVIGFSRETVKDFREVTEVLWTSLRETDFDTARLRISDLMKAEIADHRQRRPDDYLTSLLNIEISDGDTTRLLRDDELVGILTTFAVAGHETTMNAAGHLVHLLASDLVQQDRLREQPKTARQYVEEMLRLRTPAQNFARRTRADVDVAGCPIAKDSTVLLSLAAANRDPARYPDPDRFDPTRDTRGHLAFGWGIHQCIGASLARAELRILLETLCGHPRFTPAGPAEFSDLRGGNHLGPTQLPLRFEEAQ